MELVLRRQGYVYARSRVERALNSREATVEATVHFTPGPLFRFGKLEMNGLSEDTRQRAERMWTLRTGQPMDGEYPRSSSAR